MAAGACLASAGDHVERMRPLAVVLTSSVLGALAGLILGPPALQALGLGVHGSADIAVVALVSGCLGGAAASLVGAVVVVVGAARRRWRR